jgi:hypothetical protein
MPAPTIVYDTATPHFKENRIFDYEYAAKFPGAFWLASLGERARQRGWAVMTADVFLRDPSAVAVCVSDMVTPYTHALLAHGVVPAVIFSGESPNVAWDFYHRLGKYAHPYHHAYLFRGAVARVGPPVQTHPLYWPNARREAIPGHMWQDREYLVMIASNKDRFAVSARKPFLGLRRFAKRIIWNSLQSVDPLFRFEDLYQKRLDAVIYFAGVPGFRLYGTAWDQAISGFGAEYVQAARRGWAGPLDYQHKREVMSNFKFAFCFENCVFPGYVTEKIFDCFLAGSIPVYFGAPDIADFVPPQTFVDYRQFGNYSDLNQFLRGMTESESRHYLEAAQDFLASPAFDKFTGDHFVTDVLNVTAQEFNCRG